MKHVTPYFAHQLTSQNGTCAQNFFIVFKTSILFQYTIPHEPQYNLFPF